MAKNADVPPFYWHDNVYRAKIFSRVVHCYDCDCTPFICRDLGRPCMTIDATHCVLKLVK